MVKSQNKIEFDMGLAILFTSTATKNGLRYSRSLRLSKPCLMAATCHPRDFGRCRHNVEACNRSTTVSWPTASSNRLGVETLRVMETAYRD
jgi:hypothetical protein